MVELVLASFEGISWQTTLHGKEVVDHENIRVTCFIFTKLPFESPLNLGDVIEDQFYQRWKMLKIDLHYAGALFNPYLLGEVCLHDDADAKEIFNKVLRKIACTPTTYPLAFKKFTNFVGSQGPFFDTPLVKDLYLFPHEWWDLIGTSGRTLAPIVCHILAQVCSASLCKCNWISYSFVHNKV
jgi:hypothetical protein